MEHNDTTPVYAISVAAQLTDLHPQTLRQYDRLGLVSPQRANGRNRLYSMRDITRLQEIADLSAAGVNLAGIQRVLDLEAQLDRAREQLTELRRDKPSTALVLWNPRRRRRA
ncbi:MAG: MerR family transcriptional regulator [Candidatus Nanopelagicales bacterium]